MAIKGKGRTRGRQVARAPRRAPIEVKPPFFMRRRVQVSLAFTAGILVMLLAVWVTNGLRQQGAKDRAKAEAAKQRTAALRWQTEVEGVLGKVGTLAPGAPPTLLPTIGPTIGTLQKGKLPPGAAASLKTAQGDAQGAIGPLQKFALADDLRGKGFDQGEVNYFLNSQKRLVEALQLYQRAAAIAARAAVAKADERRAIADQAAAVQATGDQVLQEGWADYQQALFAGGISQTPLSAGSSG